MDRLSTLIVVHPLVVGGTEKLVVNLINHLDSRIVDVSLVTIGRHNPLAAEIRVPSALPIAIQRRFRGDIWSPARALRQVILQRGVEVILAFGLWEFVFVRLATRGLSLPSLISLHFTVPRNLKNYLSILAYARFVSRRERLVSVCDAQAEYLSRRYSIPRHQFRTIYNGVDTTFFDPIPVPEEPFALRKAIGLPPNGRLILQVASLAPVKRHEDSCRALRILSGQRPDLDVHLVLVGAGSNERRTSLESLAVALGIRDRVHFLGVQADLRPYYRVADCFTLSSGSEAFSVAALEALSMGLPCVLTDVGGAREVVQNGLNGYLVAPRHPNALAEYWALALDCQFDRSKIRQDVVSRFHIRQCARAYQDLLVEAAESCRHITGREPARRRPLQ